MNPIKKNKYSIFFNLNGYTEISKYILQNKFEKILIITDDNTKESCLDVFLSSFKNQNNEIYDLISSRSHNYSVKFGEANKNIYSSILIWKFLIKKGFKRNDLIINLGGGMITDLGGFVASTYMRGIKFINIPTTLLGMVDASIGGKTGIDFNGIKNIIGDFKFAKIILIDFRYLKTLSKRQKIAGYAEMIKHCLLGDRDGWSNIKKVNSIESISKKMIYHSINIKINIIDKDPLESEVRKYLNFGHTLGHAIESYLLGTKQELLHGEAIAIGLILETYLSYLKKDFDYEIVKEVKSYIKNFFKIVKFNEADISKIINLLKYDKKNIDEKPRFVLLEDLGKPIINQLVNEKDIIDAFKFYTN